MHGTHARRGHGIRGCRLCDTEIRHLQVAVLCHDDILRLDIPVDHMVIMGSLQAGCDLHGEIQRLVHGETAVQSDILLQGDPLHQLHNDEISAVIFAYVINADDIRMRESCGSLCLHTELRNEIRIIGIFGLQYLYCHKPLQAMILRAVDRRHSSGAHHIDDLVPFI